MEEFGVFIIRDLEGTIRVSEDGLHPHPVSSSPKSHSGRGDPPTECTLTGQEVTVVQPTYCDSLPARTLICNSLSLAKTENAPSRYPQTMPAFHRHSLEGCFFQGERPRV